MDKQNRIARENRKNNENNRKRIQLRAQTKTFPQSQADPDLFAEFMF